MRMRQRTPMQTGGVVLALVLVTGCTDQATGAAGSTRRSEPPQEVSQPSSDVAASLCETAAGAGGTVLSAHVTTVDQVRQHRIGPSPGIAPAAEPWAELSGGDPAAWCAVRARSTYTVAAVAGDAAVVVFMTASTPLDVDPGGPPVP